MLFLLCVCVCVCVCVCKSVQMIERTGQKNVEKSCIQSQWACAMLSRLHNSAKHYHEAKIMTKLEQ